jgi:hypothetical protein
MLTGYKLIDRNPWPHGDPDAGFVVVVPCQFVTASAARKDRACPSVGTRPLNYSDHAGHNHRRHPIRLGACEAR